MVSLDLDPYVIGAFNNGGACASLHSPVRLILGSKPRDDGVRCIKVPISHPAVLPAGPQRKCVPIEVEGHTDEQLGADYPGCIKQLEMELNAIAGLDEDARTHFCGRTQGPACSIACGPATVYRNYFAPVQSGLLPFAHVVIGCALVVGVPTLRNMMYEQRHVCVGFIEM